MRITYLSTMTNYYGGEVHLVSLAAGMQRRGHHVSCIVKPGSSLESRLREHEIPVYCLPLVDWFEPVTIARLRRLLHQLDCQILHTHMPRDYFIAATATLGSSTVNIATRHLLQSVSLATVKRPFMGRFSRMIAVSEAVGDILGGSSFVPSNKITTIYNGIAPEPISRTQGKKPGRLHMLAGIASGDPVVGFVGRLCPSKGLETLVRAAKELLPTWPRVKVLVVGDGAADGNYQRKLEMLIADLGLERVVRLLGYVKDAGTVGREFDAQVVCSSAEPFGLVTLEAMNQMCPVVVTNTGGSPEIVRDGVEGFLVPPGDHEILARRLDVLLDSPGLRREMGERGKERVASSFSLDQMLAKTEDLYGHCLQGNSARTQQGSA